MQLSQMQICSQRGTWPWEALGSWAGGQQRCPTAATPRSQAASAPRGESSAPASRAERRCWACAFTPGTWALIADEFPPQKNASCLPQLSIHLCCCSASLCAVGDHKQRGPAWGLRALRLKAKDGQCQNHPPWGFTDLHIQLLAGHRGGRELPSPTGHPDPHLPDCTGLMPGAQHHEGPMAAPVHGMGQKKRALLNLLQVTATPPPKGRLGAERQEEELVLCFLPWGCADPKGTNPPAELGMCPGFVPMPPPSVTVPLPMCTAIHLVTVPSQPAESWHTCVRACTQPPRAVPEGAGRTEGLFVPRCNYT